MEIEDSIDEATLLRALSKTRSRQHVIGLLNSSRAQAALVHRANSTGMALHELKKFLQKTHLDRIKKKIRKEKEIGEKTEQEVQRGYGNMLKRIKRKDKKTMMVRMYVRAN